MTNNDTPEGPSDDYNKRGAPPANNPFIEAAKKTIPPSMNRELKELSYGLDDPLIPVFQAMLEKIFEANAQNSLDITDILTAFWTQHVRSTARNPIKENLQTFVSALLKEYNVKGPEGLADSIVEDILIDSGTRIETPVARRYLENRGVDQDTIDKIYPPIKPGLIQTLNRDEDGDILYPDTEPAVQNQPRRTNVIAFPGPQKP